MKLFKFNLYCAIGSISAYSFSKASSRRDLFESLSKSAVVGMGTATFLSVSNVQALEMCPPKANNCVRTTWTPPAGTSNADIVKAVRDTINSYPQEGQSDVDGGGWIITSDNLLDSGLATIEYRSSGKGNFAKFFNGGRPFVDDLKLEFKDGKVEVKSQSRVGDSDFGVNKKRVDYLAASLASKGWSI